MYNQKRGLQKNENPSNERLQFLEYVDEYLLMYKTQMQIKKQISLLKLMIFPFKMNGELVRISNRRLKVDLNRLVLESSGNKIIGGFKLKIHPVSQILFVQNSCFCNNYSKQQILIRKRNDNYFERLLQQYKKQSVLKQTLFKYLKLVQNNTIFQKKTQYMQQLMKLSFNSSFYTWSALTKKCTGDNYQLKPSNQQLEVWSDIDSSNQDYCCNYLHNSSEDTADQVNKESTDSQKQIINFNKTSQLYSKSKSVYNKIGLNLNKLQLRQSEFTEIQQKDLPTLVKYFIREDEDLILHQKYLKKYQSDFSQINKGNKIFQKANNYMNSQKKIDTPKKIAKRLIQECLNYKDKILSQIYFDSNQSDDQQTQFKQEISLGAFLQLNKETLSKHCQWQIILSLMQNWVKNNSKSSTNNNYEYLELKTIKIIKGLNINRIQKKVDIFSPFSSCKKDKEYLSYRSKSVIQHQEKEKVIEKQLNQQKRIACTFLSIIIKILFPNKFLINKITDSSLKIFKKRIICKQLIDEWMEGSDSKFKNISLQMQSAILYLYYKAKLFQNGPFADWILIICEFYSQLIHNNSVI